MKRLGLIGDVHAEDDSLATALARLERERVDGVLCAGDIVDGRGDVDRCVELLEAHGVAVVAGNHERWLIYDQMRDLPEAKVLDLLREATRWYLAHLPRLRRFETVAGPLLLCHGLGKDDMAFVHDDGVELRRNVEPGRTRLRARGQLGIEPDIRIIVGGHTHSRWVGRFGRLTFVNAGTLRGSDCPCFGVLDLDERVVRWFDLDSAGRVVESELAGLDPPPRRRP